MSAVPEWVRSTVITFVVSFALAISASGFEFTQAALVAAAIAAGRTALSAVFPGGSFGVSPVGGAEPDREFPVDEPDGDV